MTDRDSGMASQCRWDRISLFTHHLVVVHKPVRTLKVNGV